MLSISTKNRAHDFVMINGQRYRLHYEADLTLRKSVRVHALGAQLGPLLQRLNELNEPQLDELSGLLDAFCRQILEAPAKVHSALRDTDRLAICQAYVIGSKNSNA